MTNDFNLYQNLYFKIINKTISKSDFDILRSIVKVDSEFEDLKRLISGKKFIFHRNIDYNSIYKKFVLCTPSSDILFNMLEQKLFNIHNQVRNNIGRLGNLLAWPWSYAAETCIIGYLTSREIRFLDILFHSIDTILPLRDCVCGRIDSLRGKFMNSWGSLLYSDSRWINRITLFGRTAFPILQLCRIVANDISHNFYMSKCDEYLSVLESGFDDFLPDYEVLAGGSGGIYRWPLDGNVEPLNHIHAAGNCLIALWLLTGRAEYKSMAEQIAVFFYSTLNTYDNSFTWGYNPTPENRLNHPPEAIWKGQITLSFVLTAYENAILFSRDDMLKFSNTFTNFVCLGDNKFNRYVGKKIDPLRDYIRTNRKVMGLMGWIFLDRFSPNIRNIIENAIASRLDLFKLGWFGSPQLARGYAYRMSSIGSAKCSIYW